MSRKELITYIKKHDKKYIDFDFNKYKYSDLLLEEIKKRIDRREAGKDSKESGDGLN